MLKSIGLACLLLLCSVIFAQSNEAIINLESKSPAFDTSRIKSYSNKFGIYLYSIRKFRTYELKSTELDEKLKFEPNGQTNLGFGFNYKWMGIGVAFSMPFMNKDNDVYGETTRFDLQLNMFSRFIGVSAYLQNYKGFHLANANKFLGQNITRYPYLGDLQSVSLGVEAFYFFNNKKFSYKAAFIRNEVQKSSAGGFILGGYYKLTAVNAPSGFIPSELPDSLHQIFNLNGYQTYAAGISLGYAHTFVMFKRAFLSLSAVPGIGYRNLTIYRINQDELNVEDGSGSFTARVSFGYEGKRLYWGFASIVALESFKYESVNISASTGHIRLYIGKRFDFNLRKRKKQGK